jgi:hypothetical protein
MLKPTVVLGERDSRSLSYNLSRQREVLSGRTQFRSGSDERVADLVLPDDEQDCIMNRSSAVHQSEVPESYNGDDKPARQNRSPNHSPWAVMTPPPTTKKSTQHAHGPATRQARNSGIWADVGPSYTSQRPRQVPATSATVYQAKVKAAGPPSLSRGDRGLRGLGLEYNKRLDPMYDPMKDPEHWVHDGCNIPIPGVEGATSRAERAHIRRQRRT